MKTESKLQNYRSRGRCRIRVDEPTHSSHKYVKTPDKLNNKQTGRCKHIRKHKKWNIFVYAVMHTALQQASFHPAKYKVSSGIYFAFLSLLLLNY